MAAEWDETCLDVSVSDYDSNVVTRLQAVCRGWRVRKKLKEAQMEFQQIVQELDGPAMTVQWTESRLPCPVVCKLSKKTRTLKHQDQMHSCNQGSDSTPNNLKMPTLMRELKCPKCAERVSERPVNKNVTSKNGQHLMPKPCSHKTQSDQEVQTDTVQGDQQQPACKETHAEKNSDSDPAAMDSSLVVKEAGCQAGNNFDIHCSQNQSHAERDSLNVRTDQKQNNAREHHKAAVGDTDRGEVNVPCPLDSDPSPFSSSLEPSSQAVVSSDSFGASAGMRRIDSFHGDQTSVWDSSSSVLLDQETASKQPRGQQGDSAGADMTEVKLRSLSTDELLKQRQNVAMELLWVQQAIISRKKYLKLKMQMDAAA